MRICFGWCDWPQTKKRWGIKIGSMFLGVSMPISAKEIELHKKLGYINYWFPTLCKIAKRKALK